MNENNNITYKPAPEVLFTEVNDEMVLYDPNRGLNNGVYILDDIGARIWQLLMELDDISEIANQLMREYDVDEVTVKIELDSLIAQLIEQGFLTQIPKINYI